MQGAVALESLHALAVLAHPLISLHHQQRDGADDVGGEEDQEQHPKRNQPCFYWVVSTDIAKPIIIIMIVSKERE